MTDKTTLNKEFLIASESSYLNGALPKDSGLHLITCKEDINYGFYAYLYQDNDGNYILSFPGNSGSLNQWETIAGIATSNIYNSEYETLYNNALIFTQQLVSRYGNNIYVTGHSLGGSEAEYVASKLNLSGASFGSPGIPNYDINYSNSNSNNFYVYKYYLDPVANILPGNYGISNIQNYGQVEYLTGSKNKQDENYYLNSSFFATGIHYNHSLDNYSYQLMGEIITNDDAYNSFVDKLNIYKTKNNIASSSTSKDPIIIYSNRPAITNLDNSSTYYAYDGKTEQRTAWVAGGYNNSSFLVKLDNSGNPVLLTDSDLTSMGVNGIIDSNNNNWNNLYLWADNGDGKLESGELTALTNSGISSIQTQLTIQNTDANGSTLVSSGKINMKDGSTEKVGDVNLATDSTYTITQKDQELSAGTLSTTVSGVDLTTLPNWHGYGVLSSLTASMITINSDGTEALNSTLYQDVLGLTKLDLSKTSYQTLLQSFDTLLKDWSDTGTVYEGNTNIALPDTEMFNNYHLQVLDKYLGQATYFEGHQTYISYGYPPKVFLDEAYQELESNLISEFFIQSHLTNIQTYISYDVTDDQFTSQTSYADLLTYINQTYPNISSDSSLYHILSDIIYNSAVSQDISIPDLFNDMKTINANQAAQIVMTGENIQITNDTIDNSISLQPIIAGGKNYIWSGNINEQIIYNSYNTDYITPQSDTLFINDNLDNISVSVNLSNILFTNSSNSLNINNNELKNITEIDFKDQSIENNNNELTLKNISIVTGDTSILNDNMYVIAQNATVTYDFSRNVNISALQDTTINLVTTNTLTIKDITYNNNLLAITQNGYTIIFQENNSDIQLEQNGKLITYLFNNSLLQSYSNHTNYSQTIISSEGIYGYDASVFNNNILIQNTTGTDTIYMSGDNSGTNESLNYTAGSTTKMFQISATNIQIQSDNLIINLKNVIGSSSSNANYLLFSDLQNVNGKDLMNSQFNCIQSSGILETGYYGNFTDTLNVDVNDIEIRYGTINNITDSDGHDIFIESMNGKITANSTTVNIYVTNDNTFSNGNIYSLLSNFASSGVYENGNIVFKSNNHEYKIMNASDFVNHLTLSFIYNGESASFNLINSNINYNITDETFNANELSSINTVNLTGKNTTVTENVTGYNTYNILSNGNYIINQNVFNIDTININTPANLELNGFKNGQININEQFNQFIINEDYKGDMILTDALGYSLQIDNYSNFSGTIKFSDTTLSVINSQTITQNTNVNINPIIKNEYITLYGQGLTTNYTDNNAITSIIQKANNSKETFNLSNNSVMYGANGSDYNNQITINLINNNFTMGDIATYTNVILNGETLSYDYVWNNSNGTASTIKSHMTINNVINYFNTGNNQDLLKIDFGNSFPDITTSLKRNVISETQDSTITTTHNKILLSNNLNIIDNGSDNEIMFSNNQESISIASNDRLLIDNATIDKVSFLIENGHLDIKNGLKEYALINMQSSQLATDINANISLSDGHSISVKNAFTFATDYESMTKTGLSSTNLIDLVSQNDYNTLIGLYNQ